MKYGYETTESTTYQLLSEKAKYMRNHPTEAERKLWQHLSHNQLGVYFRRQQPVFDYIPDFVCLAAQLIIEVDGGYHTTSAHVKKTVKEQLGLKQKDLPSFAFRTRKLSHKPATS